MGTAVDPPQVIDARDHESRLGEKNSGAQAFLIPRGPSTAGNRKAGKYEPS